MQGSTGRDRHTSEGGGQEGGGGAVEGEGERDAVTWLLNVPATQQQTDRERERGREVRERQRERERERDRERQREREREREIGREMLLLGYLTSQQHNSRQTQRERKGGR